MIKVFASLLNVSPTIIKVNEPVQQLETIIFIVSIVSLKSMGLNSQVTVIQYTIAAIRVYTERWKNFPCISEYKLKSIVNQIKSN